MSNGKALAEGIGYLADKFADGDKCGVQVILSRFGDNLLHVYLIEGKSRTFDSIDVEFMESLGFHYEECDNGDFNVNTYQDENYSYFYISV